MKSVSGKNLEELHKFLHPQESSMTFGRLGFRRVAGRGVPHLPCGLSVGLHFVWTKFLTVSNLVARPTSSAGTCSMSSAPKLVKYGVRMTHSFQHDVNANGLLLPNGLNVT